MRKGSLLLRLQHVNLGFLGKSCGFSATPRQAWRSQMSARCCEPGSSVSVGSLVIRGHFILSIPMIPFGQFLGDYGQDDFFCVPQHGQLRGNADGRRDQVAVQSINAGDRLAIVSHDDIAFAQSGTACGTAWFETGNENPVLRLQPMESENSSMNRDVLSCHTDPTAAEAALFDQPRCYKLRRVTGNGKANALGRKDDRCINSDNFTARVHKRPTRISWIQSSISLNHVINQPAGLRPHRTAKRADHSRSYRLVKPKRAADGYGNLPNTDRM